MWQNFFELKQVKQMNSRTNTVFKNLKISFIFFALVLVINFIARSVFIKYLGENILGATTVIGNLMGFLNIADLGITAAIASALYSPIATGNRNEINAILAIQDWFYKRVGIFVLLSGLIMMIFLPLIFQKVKIPLWNIYSIFILFWLTSLATYFITFKQVLLIAEMKEYKILLYVKSMFIIKMIIQIICLSILNYGFKSWIILEFIYLFASTLILHYLISYEYPWLKIDKTNIKQLLKDYPNVLNNTKQLFFHRVATFGLTHSTPFIIFYYFSTKTVTIIDNYMIIILGFISLIGNIFSSLQGAIGNLVVSSKQETVREFLDQYIVFRFWLALLISLTFFYQSSNFIIIWVGENFIVDKMTLILLTIYLFITLARTIESFLFAYQAFYDIYAPIAEAIINIGLSFILGYFYGLSGIISGVVISLVIIAFGWKPFFLYRKVFKISWNYYWIKATNYFFCSIMVVVLAEYINTFLKFNEVKQLSYQIWILSTLKFVTLLFISSICIFLILNSDFRKFNIRIVKKLLGKY